MCVNLLDNSKCSLRIKDADGAKDVNLSMEIRRAFDEAKVKSPTYKDSPLGVACGPQWCCFLGSNHVKFNDCPYFEPTEDIID